MSDLSYVLPFLTLGFWLLKLSIEIVLHFGSVIVFFSLMFPFGSFFYISYLFELLILFLYCFPDFVDWISRFHCSSLSTFRTVTLNSLSGISHVTLSLGSVTGSFLGSSDGVLFPWFCTIPVALQRCLHIWSSSHLFLALWSHWPGKPFTYWWGCGGACCGYRDAGCQVQGYVASLQLRPTTVWSLVSSLRFHLSSCNGCGCPQQCPSRPAAGDQGR